MVFNVKDSEERITVVPENLPYEVLKLENVEIPMKDGAKLYAHVWIPKAVYEGTQDLKLGCLVEYLPYRKNDFTAIRDSIRHPYYAAHGLVSMRVDMRGCGDSDGVLHGEYLLQEQNDNLEVFDWIVRQKWSNGNIGQFGKSWGGFNGLQIAARQHPNLKTIITLCSTDDRYSDDVHYRGGCLLASDMLWWASTMLAYNARPQDPRVKPDWKQNWLQRLELEPNIIDWLTHQTRDEFWQHGSICEDYNKVDIPVLAVGGWRDGYVNPIFRMMKNLPNKECKSIVGPWVHEYPEVATPHPGVGYNQIAVQWFSKYLTTEESVKQNVGKLNVGDFHVDQLGRINAYLQEPCSISESYDQREGKWLTVAEVESKSTRFGFDLKSSSLTTGASSSEAASFSGIQEYGLLRGTWCPFGQAGDFPADQKIEDSKSFTIDTQKLEQDIEILGFPVVKLMVSSSTKIANISARLVHLNPETQENVLVSWGILNLNKVVGTSEHPADLEPGKKYEVELKLDAIGYRVPKGHQLRLALSTTDWPSFWPLAETPTLTIHGEGCSLELPLPTGDKTVENWPTPESLAPSTREILREETRTRRILNDVINNTWEIDDFSDEGKRMLVSNEMQMGSWNKNSWFVKENDPLSAKNSCDWELTLGRDADNWQVKLCNTSTMTADATHFYVYNRMTAFEDDKQVFDKQWENKIPRNYC